MRYINYIFWMLGPYIIIFLSFLPKIYASSESNEKKLERLKSKVEHNNPKTKHNKSKKDPMAEYEITNNYVHQWIPFPTINGKSVLYNNNIIFKPKKDYASVVFFISSWCIPCQNLMGRFKQLEKKYSGLYTRFFYVMSHDTAKDAKGFNREYKIGENCVNANFDILKNFHNPELPSIYVADRRGWLTMRYIKATYKDTEKLEHFLDLINGI